MSKFLFEKTPIAGLFVITPTIFGDHRGYFMETYQREEFAAAGIEIPYNHMEVIVSKKG